MAVTMNIVNIILAEGGFVRFVWKTCQARIVRPDGEALRIDPRTYRAIPARTDLVRSQQGSSEAGDLIIEWRLAKELER